MEAARFIREPERNVPVLGEYEVVVLGGGPAGIAAAAAAAENGRKVLLVERYGFLGGMGTAAGVTNFCGLHANVYGEHRQVVHGMADELLARIERIGGLNAPHLLFGRILAQAYDTAAYKCAADDLMLAKGVRLLFHALGAGVSLSTAKGIDALLVETKSGRRAITGKVFIDCSGDGDLAAWAGAPLDIGDGGGNMLYPTMMFRVSGVDPIAAGEAWTAIPRLMEEAELRGEKFSRSGVTVRPQKHPGEWRVNATQIKTSDGRALDGTNAGELSAGEIEGRRQALSFLNFLRRDVKGFADSYIVDMPPQLGIRETRRLRGQYQLSRGDVLGCADFPDAIGVNGWPIEAHTAGKVEWRWQAPGSRGFNQLPYRMLLPRGVRNLLVAGRCASMTHEGQSAARVSGACFVMGEAAGTAAHLSLSQAKAPDEISTAELQRMLKVAGCYLGSDTRGRPAPSTHTLGECRGPQNEEVA